MPQQPVQAAAGQPVEEDVSINIAGHKIKGRLIMKIAAIVAAACFFFPMFTVSCAGVNVGNVSMADLTFETEDTTQDSYYDYYDSDEEENGTVGMIVFLLAPISAFCICMVKNEGKGWGKEAVAAFGSSALANVGTVQHVEKPNVWVKTALYTVGETFAIYVLFFLLSATF